MTSPSDKLTSSSREVDPLLKDLSEKKQNFRRGVVSLAAELKDVRARLASQQNSLAREALTRQEAESRVKNMESEMSRLKRSLEERDLQLKASTSAAETYIKELDDLSLALSSTKESAHASAQAAQSAQVQCSALAKELEEKNISLKEHEIHVNKLQEQMDLLQKDLEAREHSQMQLKEEVFRIEREIMQSLTNAGAKKDCELRRILEEVSPKNFERINRLLSVKDDEIAKLRDEIKIMSAHWKLKTNEMESQLEKQRRVDQELKKKVLKLEFCLQEARAQTRKLQRMGERRDKALKELKDQLSARQQSVVAANSENNQKGNNNHSNNIWESSGFKIVVSMSMLILVMFSKR